MTSASEAAVKPPETNPPLRTLGKYVIERKLGQGGMGTVYLAKHTDLKKMIALKVLPQDKAKNPTLVKRFKAEAQAAAQLEHPNIVAVFDTGEIDGYLYIAMEYVDGVDLFEQVQHGGVIPVKRSIEIMKQISSALQHAFEHHIVHRDIKPSNLMLRHDGVVKVTDLGLARSIDDTLETNITRAGTTVGTVDYMAPEQARSSKSADIRSDIYSLGCTWYHMLTGSPPFPEGGLTNKLQAHAIKPLPDPREKNENIPEGVFAILQRMTAKKPDDRYQTPADLLDDLTRSKLTKAAFSNEIFSDLSDYDIDAAEKYAEQTDEEELDEDPSEKETKSKERGRIRKGPEDDDDVQPLPIRKRIRSRDASTETPLDDTQPMKPRSKSAKSKLDDDYEELEDSPEPRSTGRKAAESDYDEDEPEASSVSKRKRTSVNEESKPASTKLGKGTVAKGIIPKQSKKMEV